MDTTTSPIVSRAEFENWSDEDIVERVFTGEPAHLVIIARSGTVHQTTKKLKVELQCARSVFRD
jgi:hypothetical protein